MGRSSGVVEIYAGFIFRQMVSIGAGVRCALAWLGFGGGDEAAAFELPSDLIEEIVEPRYGIDGWTYQGTVLEEWFPPEVEAELAALTHAVCAGLATGWGYERAARLMERGRAFGQAYAVVVAYGASGEGGGAETVAMLGKWRERLARAVLAEGDGGARD